LAFREIVAILAANPNCRDSLLITGLRFSKRPALCPDNHILGHEGKDQSIMKRINIVGLCVTTALALGVISVANASAAEFIVKKQGTGLVLGKQVGKLAFKIPSAGTVECTEAAGMSLGEATLGKPFPFLLLPLIYEKCTFLGLTATVTEGMYDFNANGTVRVVEKEEDKEKAKRLEISVVGCKVIVGEAGNTALGKVEYVNKAGGEIEIVLKITGATAELVGATCPVKGVVKTAEVTGNLIVMEEGGEIEVK
jgi:hypothetical protein